MGGDINFLHLRGCAWVCDSPMREPVSTLLLEAGLPEKSWEVGEGERNPSPFSSLLLPKPPHPWAGCPQVMGWF